jgi:hypothetical protein
MHKIGEIVRCINVDPKNVLVLDRLYRVDAVDESTETGLFYDMVLKRLIGYWKFDRFADI